MIDITTLPKGSIVTLSDELKDPLVLKARSAIRILDSIREDETYCLAMNEMSEDVNNKFCEAMDLLQEIADA